MKDATYREIAEAWLLIMAGYLIGLYGWWGLLSLGLYLMLRYRRP